MSIYLDNAATTRPVFTGGEEYYIYGNPSSTHKIGTKAYKNVDKVRSEIAYLIGASKEEILFTSGGTESDNWALKGYLHPGDHLITSQIEHHAILNTAKYLEKNGVEVTYLPVNKHGRVSLQDLEDNIKENTKMISIMFVNNEIGTIQDIKAIGKIAKSYHITFHTDAVQAFLKIPLNVRELNIDMLSASFHKIGAYKGTGFLYVKKELQEKLEPLLHGGKQEYGLRAGTENVPGILSFSHAIDEYDCCVGRAENLVDLFIKKLVGKDINFRINGDPDYKLKEIVSITFFDIPSLELTTMLNENRIYISSGAACSSGQSKPSHVLKAIGMDDDEALKTVRFSFSGDISKVDIDVVIDKIEESIKTYKLFSLMGNI